MKHMVVTDADHDIRLDRWFRRHCPAVPQALLEKSLRQGKVKLDGRKAKSSDRVAAGQAIALPEAWLAEAPSHRPTGKPPPVMAEDARKLEKTVLYRDADVMIVNKPPGVAVQGGTGQKHSLDAMLDVLRFDASERPRLVHRLDRDTSGCLVLARSARAAAELARLFAGRGVEKIYVALVIGLPRPLAGTIRLPLAKLERGRHSRTAAYESVGIDEEAGKPAVTEYRVLEHLSDTLSWVELRPLTGRTHQLRVHMAETGHPIVGDGKYGGAKAFVRGMKLPPQLHLHAQRIIIPDLRGRRIDTQAPLPPHMRQSREMLGLD